MRNLFFSCTADILEVVVRDTSGKKITQLRCNISDSREATKILRILMDKYGFAPAIDFKNLYSVKKHNDSGNTSFVED